MNTAIGYSITGAGEDDRGMMEKFSTSEEDEYKNVYTINYLDDEYKMSSRCRKYDLVSTYDGYHLVSDKFKQFCEENNYPSLEFYKLKKEVGFYWMKVNSVVFFDHEKKQSIFEQHSEKYDAYYGIYRATPVILKQQEKLQDGFYRTDLFFGDGHKKSPIILIGTETKDKIKKYSLKGVYFEKIAS